MKTVIEMAREAGDVLNKEWLEAFAELVRADEREACANLVFHSPPSDEYESPLVAVYNAIQERSNA